jgi:hypothetical protein
MADPIETAPPAADATPPAIDLQAPAVQAAIRAASEAQAASVKAEYEGRLAALEANKNKILEEKKSLAAEMEKASLAAKAAAIQADPAKLNSLAEELATTKFDAHKRAYQEADQVKDGQLQELAKAVDDGKAALRRANLLRELYAACIPADQAQLVQPGAFDYLCQALEAVTEERQIDGLPMPVIRFKVGGTYLAAVGKKTPDGLMDMEEFLSLTRQGKGPMPNLGFCFTSAGRGSGGGKTGDGETVAGADVEWDSLDQDRQTELAKKNGIDWARRQIDRASAKRLQRKTA